MQSKSGEYAVGAELALLENYYDWGTVDTEVKLFGRLMAHPREG
jgi:hypothetical protein